MPNTYGYPPLDQQRCGNCRYAIHLVRHPDKALSCRRHPPVVLPRDPNNPDPTTWGTWPAVFPDAWCGHWALVEGRS